MSNRAAALLRIIAYARRGALDQAWDDFRAEGLDQIIDDPAVLTLKGRLLKDEAFLARGQERQRQAQRAADAYNTAASLAPAPYPLINAATLALIAGDKAKCQTLAAEALRLISAGVADETPYWLKATQAEAKLLSGDLAAAQSVLAQAIAVAPHAWEDHASTLRQFSVILDEIGLDGSWLDALRPPRSLHFVGDLSLGSREAAIGRDVDQFLEENRIGFAFGALAAGADLLVAERIVARGAEFTAVLPLNVPQFLDRSVRPYGPEWVQRFERVLGSSSRTIVVEDAHAADDHAFESLVLLANLIAMGRAVMNAAALQSGAIQLVIGETLPVTSAGFSEQAAEVWRSAGRRQRFIRSSLVRSNRASPPSSGALASVLVIEFGDQTKPSLAFLRDLEARLEPVRDLLADTVLACPARWSATGLLLVFSQPADAIRSASLIRNRLRTLGPVRQGLHVGVLVNARVPGSASVQIGPAVKIAELIASAAPEGAVYASSSFVAALIGFGGSVARTALVGELSAADLASEVELYAIIPSQNQIG
jgi:hypothetical protein